MPSGGYSLHRVVRDPLSEVTLKLKDLKRGKAVSHAKRYVEELSRRRNSKSRGPKVGACIVSRELEAGWLE